MRPVKVLRALWGKSRGERGIVLVSALLVMVLLLPLGVIFLNVSMTESTIASNEVSAAQVFSIAEAGIEHARKELDTADIGAILASNPPLMNFTNGGQNVSFASGTYSVQVSNNITAIGAIPADPGGATNDTDNIVILTSTGTRGSATRSIEAVVQRLIADFLKYGFASTGAVFSDEITFASQPGGRNDSYNGGPGVYKPSLSTGYYSGGNVPSGGGWSSLQELSTRPTFPPVDFARYAASSKVVNLNALRDANGVVSLTDPSQITDNTVYYVDGSFDIAHIGNNPTVSLIATHDIKLNPGQGMTAVSEYPLFLAGGYIYLDTDDTTPLIGAIYSDGSHALAADRTYPINPLWVGHGTDLVYVESHSQIIGAVAARIPEGSGLRLFGGGGSTVTYDMNLLNGLTDLYVGQSDGSKYLSWREK